VQAPFTHFTWRLEQLPFPLTEIDVDWPFELELELVLEPLRLVQRMPPLAVRLHRRASLDVDSSSSSSTSLAHATKVKARRTRGRSFVMPLAEATARPIAISRRSL
jgi:hypothetical protein